MAVSTAIHDSFSSTMDEDAQSEPEKTTLLFNTANGRPTATSIQMSQLTSSVISTPSSFISLAAGVVPGATVTTSATSISDSPSGRGIPASHVTAAALGLGVAVVSTVLLVSIYSFYKVAKRRTEIRGVSKRPQPPTTPSNWSTSPLSSPNSLEKGGKSPSSTQSRPSTPRKPVESSREKTSCHVVLEDKKQLTEQCCGSSMTSTDDYVSSAGERDRQRRSLKTASIREDRRFRLRAPNHSQRAQAIWEERSQNLPTYDNVSLPPLPQQGPAEVRELTSILKRPSNAQADTVPAAARGSGKGWLGSVQTRFGAERETYKPTFAGDKVLASRKGVTFAAYPIKESRKTPMASRVASVAGGSTLGTDEQRG
ncbi:MAG: hypothetical protein LQ347_004157 [Umbilicaria vellea]|nr:MAG: hypothetical protein LQ347_004157 [Umbilicaria vellea]